MNSFLLESPPRNSTIQQIATSNKYLIKAAKIQLLVAESLQHHSMINQKI